MTENGCSQKTSTMKEEDWSLETPVVMIIYNRPENTQEVFDQIAMMEPSELLVVADGPKDKQPGDEDRCRSAREVTEAVDWECDVSREYADSNLGLRKRFQTGLNWVFNEVEEAIILEDDCLPSQSFFRFTEDLLEEYRNDERVMDISGSNHLGTWKDSSQDYHFTRYGGIWGWATWADQWEKYRANMEGWDNPEIRNLVRAYIGDEDQWPYIRHLYQRTAKGSIETWDYQWGFTRAVNWGLTATPSRNLISNIGFGEEATNTTAEESSITGVSRHELEFPIEIRDTVASDFAYDRTYFKQKTSIWDRYPTLQKVKTMSQRLGVDEYLAPYLSR